MIAIDPSKTPLDYRDPKADVRPGPTAKRILAWVIGSLAALMLLGSILMPSLGLARETAQRVKCASNLKQIGQALLLYANENRGQPAPDWPTLLSTQALVPEVFICPSSDLHKATGATPAQVNAELLDGEHLSYVYVRDALNAHPDEVIAFDLELHVPRDNATTTGVNVLLGDGSVQFVDEATAKAIRTRYFAGVRPIRLSDCTPRGGIAR